jgi:hypothetical protein
VDDDAEYQTYLLDIRGGMIGNMGLPLADFKAYIAGLRNPDLAKISQPSLITTMKCSSGWRKDDLGDW